ncbi:SpoIIE family protein phosphatase [Actinocrinis puniceicyclus]|uniref:histidine kinase n=1 Tax=Actinocrinis puniceicyclus TaxID=977794 RepID=A0A8J8BEB5_9ACTN|nr:SpoIIE family protein phosphatase [Actinocrinis puniceicyclus]MBS2965350.1 SpoIIE family protein phosphatase [Actinocrinis puniceicyclus]
MADATGAYSPGKHGLPADLAAAVALGGEMSERFAAYDWSRHPLGEPGTWPAEWRSVVAAALTSRFPIVLWLGPELYLVYNDAYMPLLDQRHPAALGSSGRRVWAEIWDQIGPMLSGVMTTGRATWSDDLMLPLVTGGSPRERYFTFTYSPIIAADGSTTGIFCAVTETTQRVLSERRLQLLTETAAQLFHTRTVSDAVHAVVQVCDGRHPDLPFLAVYTDCDGEAASLAAASAPVLGRLPTRLAALLPGGASPDFGRPLVLDVREHLPTLAADIDAGGAHHALLLRLAGALPDSGAGALLLGLNPHRPLDEQYEGFCRLLADQVSAAFASVGSFELERRRADALAQLDRAKTLFLTNVSHEFRTPLTLLLGPLQDAIAAEDDPARRERLEMAQRNAGRLLRLVNSLLEFARTEAGRSDPRPVRVDLGALTAQLASSFAELCQRAGIELVLDCARTPAEVDPQMWETVVLNLLSNAVKFTVAGSITVRVAPGDGSAQVTVSDTGCGIPATDLEHLFERFYQARNPRARSMEGSGIGLSLVRSLVDLHGGTVEVDSEVERGTQVRITLPARTEAGHEAPRLGPGTLSSDGSAYLAEAMQWLETVPDPGPRSAAPPAIAPPRPLVMVVDDNADMRRHLERVCSPRWDVVLAGDGESALGLIRRRRPDLVITDVMMPKLDGLGLVAAIRADPQLASLPVVMLSARAGVEAAGAGLSAGADDYLPKPFSSADLVNRVAARLEADARERERREREQAEARWAAALAESAAALSSATSPAQLLSALLAGVAGVGASAAALGVLDAESGNVTISMEGDVPPALRERYHVVPVGAPVPLAHVIRSAQPMIIPDNHDLAAEFATVVEYAETAARAALVFPLRDRVGAVIAAISLWWPEPRTFQPHEMQLVEQASVAAGQALERIHAAEREHRIATGFQEHQLDLDRRSPAAVLGAVYQPAAEMMRVGGDWYLAAPLPEPHRLAVSVGDAVGHGLPAATVMSRLRSAAAAATLAEPAPGFVLDLLERYAGTVAGADCTTVAYAVVDTAAGVIDYACAGHPYPLLVTESGQGRYLTGGRRPPLTIGGDQPRPAGRADLPAGSLLLLYTDGLIERPGESLDAGFARLLEAATRLRHQPVDAMCSQLLEAMAPAGGYRDDVAMLALRPVGVTPVSFVATLPASLNALPGLRGRLRAWLEGLCLEGTLGHDVLLAACEAVANAVKHGSRFDPRQCVSIEAFAAPDVVSVSVGDAGWWTGDTALGGLAPRSTGLTLIHGLSSDVEIARSARGTRVTMHHGRAAVREAFSAAGARG